MRHFKFTVSLIALFCLLRLVRAEKIIALLPASGTVQAPQDFARNTAAAISAASLQAPYATCLPQALLARIVLGRRGYTAQIHIGVNRKDSLFLAHAWTTSGDLIVSGGPKEFVEEYKVIKILE